MTKYVLGSSGVRNFPEKAKILYSEVFKGIDKNPRFLVCYFAQAREVWEMKFADDMITFKNSFPSDINSVFEMALPDTFEEQVKNADVINIKGGDDHLIQYWLKQFNLSEVFRDKVIVTNSAGSNAMVKHFWTCDWRQTMDGLGILPIKFISHYKSNYGDYDPRGAIEWEKAYKELESCGDKSLPIYALEEGDFVVIEK